MGGPVSTRRRRLHETADQAMLELRREQLLGAVRVWRDAPGTDRALLVGYHDRLCGKPHFCVLVERPKTGEPRSTKVRGRSQEDALGQALQVIWMMEAAS